MGLYLDLHHSPTTIGTGITSDRVWKISQCYVTLLCLIGYSIVHDGGASFLMIAPWMKSEYNFIIEYEGKLKHFCFNFMNNDNRTDEYFFTQFQEKLKTFFEYDRDAYEVKYVKVNFILNSSIFNVYLIKDSTRFTSQKS